MVAEQNTPAWSAMGRWSDALADLHGRIARRFARAEVRERVRCYLTGLLGRVERKNGWQLAEAIGEPSPRGVQRLLNAAAWDAEGVRDDLRTYVVDHRGERASGVLILDDTGFVKKGRTSCGVARQSTGTVGDTANAQVGVFLASASEKGAAFIDRALSLPRAWTEDPDRCRAAGIPSAVRFATKITLAQRLRARAFEAEVPARWVVGDSFYGRLWAVARLPALAGRARASLRADGAHDPCRPLPGAATVRGDAGREAATGCVDRGFHWAGRARRAAPSAGLPPPFRRLPARDAALAARPARPG